MKNLILVIILIFISFSLFADNAIVDKSQLTKEELSAKIEMAEYESSLIKKFFALCSSLFLLGIFFIIMALVFIDGFFYEHDEILKAAGAFLALLFGSATFCLLIAWIVYSSRIAYYLT